jgi:hypothetical protein
MIGTNAQHCRLKSLWRGYVQGVQCMDCMQTDCFDTEQPWSCRGLFPFGTRPGIERDIVISTDVYQDTKMSELLIPLARLRSFPTGSC